MLILARMGVLRPPSRWSGRWCSASVQEKLDDRGVTSPVSIAPGRDVSIVWRIDLSPAVQQGEDSCAVPSFSRTVQFPQAQLLTSGQKHGEDEDEDHRACA